MDESRSCATCRYWDYAVGQQQIAAVLNVLPSPDLQDLARTFGVCAYAQEPGADMTVIFCGRGGLPVTLALVTQPHFGCTAWESGG